MNQSQSQDNSEVIFAVLIAALVLMALVSFIIVFIVFYQRRRRTYINEMTEVKAKFQQILLQSQLEIKEQTLQHIGYELHDNLGQVASQVAFHLKTGVISPNCDAHLEILPLGTPGTRLEPLELRLILSV